MNRRIWVTTLMAGLVLAGHVAAQIAVPQIAVPQDKPSFSATSELVVLHVSVEDGKGRRVPGLDKTAFAVHEDGRPQSIEMFSADDVPASIGLLIDNSASMWPHRDLMIASTIAFAGMSHPEDEIFVLTFNEDVRTAWAPAVIGTSPPPLFRAALIQSITARGMTALYDGIVEGVRRVAQGRHTRQVLLIVSDGSDNASQAKLDEAIKCAHESDAAVYTISLIDTQSSRGNPKFLRRLAASSGGESFQPRRVDQVLEIFKEIARDIRSSYTIAYVPPRPEQAGVRRTVRVHVKGPKGKPLSVRARDGYFTKIATEGGGAR